MMAAANDPSYRVRKTILGHEVQYKCPHCSEELTSSLDDAGDNDTCPHCDHGFVAPGVAERQQAEAATEVRHADKQRKGEAKWGKQFVEQFVLCEQSEQIKRTQDKHIQRERQGEAEVEGDQFVKATKPKGPPSYVGLSVIYQLYAFSAAIMIPLGSVALLWSPSGSSDPPIGWIGGAVLICVGLVILGIGQLFSGFRDIARNTWHIREALEIMKLERWERKQQEQEPPPTQQRRNDVGVNR